MKVKRLAESPKSDSLIRRLLCKCERLCAMEIEITTTTTIRKTGTVK